MLQFPNSVLTGAGGYFANNWSQYIETPAPFLFMSYLTVLGHLISDQVTLESELEPQPRLYTVLLGESGVTRKSTSIKKTIELFNSIPTFPNSIQMNARRGVGSAEGLAQYFGQGQLKRILLVFDELTTFVQKSKSGSSTLLESTNTLFDSNTYQNATKKNVLTINNAHLSILAAATLDTYQSMLTSKFTNIGFNNRLFVVVASGKKRESIPQSIPDQIKQTMSHEHGRVLQHVIDLCKRGINGIYRLPIEKEAHDVFHEWYLGSGDSPLLTRLDAIGHRLLILVTLNQIEDRVTVETAKKVVALLEYEYEARKQTDPIDTETIVANLEERIRRALAGGPLLKRLLERKVNKNRYGINLWDFAVKNLVRANDLRVEKDIYSLIGDQA